MTDKRFGPLVTGAIFAGVTMAMLATGGAPAQANTTQNFSGEVTVAVPNNAFGLTDGQTVSGFVIYDETLVSSMGVTELGPSDAPSGLPGGIWLSNTLGSTTLTNLNEASPGSGPILKFIDGVFVGFSLTAQENSPFPTWAYTASPFPGTMLPTDDTSDAIPGDGFYNVRGTFVLNEAGGNTRGDWNFDQAVPIPAALPLFASALAALGYAGYRKRKDS